MLGEVRSLASGPDGLLLLALSGANELLVGGGLEQRRVIDAFDPQAQTGQPARQLAVLATPLDPLSRPGQPWRIPYGTRRKATPGGLDTTFVWDSADARGGEVFLRALPRDNEPGTAEAGAAPKTLQASLDVNGLAIGDSSTTMGRDSVAAADLDGDGDMDLVAANFDASLRRGDNNLTVFFQELPGNFVADFPPLGGPLVTKRPRSVVAADLDGDSDLDIVVANQIGDNLIVYFQDPQGSFEEANRRELGDPETTNGPVSVAAADLDADGELDLVSANLDGNDLTVFFQEPSGTFVADFPPLGGPMVTKGPRSVAAADLDGNGDLDLVSANFSPSFEGNNLTVFFQEAPRTFSKNPAVLEPALPAFRSKPGYVATLDLDGDGAVDIASANEGLSNLTVFLQQASGSFATDPLVLGSADTTTSPRSLAGADLDGDGDLDVVVADRNGRGNRLTAFFQESPGSFDPTPLLLERFPTPQSHPVSVVAADLDGDGDQDLVSANEGSDKLTAFFPGSPGTFDTSPLDLGETSGNNGSLSVAAADLDGDGDQDLVSAKGINDSSLAVFFQESVGSFRTSPALLGTTASPFSVAAADLDGDSDPDLVSANPASDNLTIFFQEPRGTFDTSRELGGMGITDGARSVAAADIDGDGDFDLASANQTGHDLTIFFQESDGFPTTPQVFLEDRATTNDPHFLVAADLDGDGLGDIASADRTGNRLKVFFQGESGTFPEMPLVLGGPASTITPEFVAAADLDGDGDLDLISANTGGDGLTIFFQGESGTFSKNPAVLEANDPKSVAIADLDGDGDLDLVSANANGANLTIFFQEAPGTLFASPKTLAAPSPVWVTTTDLDGDGDQDLVSASSSFSKLRIFWGGR